MPAWIALLRAVNIGKRKYPMAELRACLTDAGYGDVETHIQTGNVRLTSPVTSREELTEDLERLFAKDRGFDVATVVLTPAELVRVGQDVAELAAEHPAGHGHYVSLLRDRPSAAKVRAMEESALPDERVVVRGRAVHLLYAKPYHEARISNVTVERIVGVATNRNARVVLALAQKWGG